MVPVTSLWLPILLAAVLVFVASSLIHMVLGFHKHDLLRVAKEDEAMDALRPFALTPGDYALPCAGSMKDAQSAAFAEKLARGPVVFFTVVPSGPRNMRRQLGQWFVYAVVVGVFAAYIAGRALAPGAHYLQVFRFAGCTAFVGYSLALWQGSIWWGRSWTTTVKSTVDGLIYALLTAGAFGWLWPR